MSPDVTYHVALSLAETKRKRCFEDPAHTESSPHLTAVEATSSNSIATASLPDDPQIANSQFIAVEAKIMISITTTLHRPDDWMDANTIPGVRSIVSDDTPDLRANKHHGASSKATALRMQSAPGSLL